MTPRPAIFLDRDGTIIEDKGYIDSISDVEFFDFTFGSLERLKKYFLFFIITNQSGISKGLVAESKVQEVNRYINKTLESNGIVITETYYCPHKDEDKCNCKKPSPYFIHKAAKAYNINLKESYVIGDHPSDVECGINAGVTPVYVLTGHGSKHANELKTNTEVCKNLDEASKLVFSKIKH